MTVPNFFIVGSPRCGTTALTEYLTEHPSVFMSERKEPHFFAEDELADRKIRTERQYATLFHASAPGETVVGEASARYLCSRVAIRRIHEFNRDAQIIVMLRHPADLVYSLHSRLLYSGEEDQRDFYTAWQLQSARCEGRSLPRRCSTPLILQYKYVAMQGQHLERLYNIFPSSQILVIYFDDFVSDARTTYERTLAFLGVVADGRTDFPRINENKEYRLRWFGSIMQKPPTSLYIMGKWMGLENSAILEQIRGWNSRRLRKPSMPEEIRKSLIEEFESDILKLQRITSRDLRWWLE